MLKTFFLGLILSACAVLPLTQVSAATTPAAKSTEDNLAWWGGRGWGGGFGGFGGWGGYGYRPYSNYYNYSYYPYSGYGYSGYGYGGYGCSSCY